jgi:NADH-quinone oxidoreductase subunit L
MTLESTLGMLGLVALFMPVAASITLGLPWVFGIKLREGTIHRTVATTFLVALIACLIIDVLVIARPGLSTIVTLAHWVVIPSYALDARVVFDGPAAVLMTLTALLGGLIGVFSAPYLHQDPGFRRFFVLLPLFSAGMMAVACGDTLDLVYAGWEVVGLASALLIAYFGTREAPVRHGLRAFAIYRVCDVALLCAAVILHHHAGDASLGAGLHLDADTGLVVALLLVFASMGKAAAFPFTGWLPRAMEGPTPSSAIFYGALSIHAGPFLLLRAWPILEDQPIARIALIVIGVVTQFHATTVGRVQTDVKAALGYASVAQVAIIMVELGFGFTTLALIHMTGHAILRTWQLLRAPSLLADQRHLVDQVGGPVPTRGMHWERVLPHGLRRWAYRASLERWFIDDFVASRVLGTASSMFHAIDRLDRRWVQLMAGPDRESR